MADCSSCLYYVGLLEMISPAAIQSIMKKHNISCRKSLGQNFLIDNNIIRKIIELAELTKSDCGVDWPGLGS